MLNRDEFGSKLRLPQESDLIESNKLPSSIKNIYSDFKSEVKDPLKDLPYLNLERKIAYNPFHQLSGLTPGKNTYETENIKLNKEMQKIVTDREAREDYYKNIVAKNKDDIRQINTINKRDHVKSIFSTLNFARKPTSYTETFDYTTDKKKSTLDHNAEYHYKKSFMKTYEENRIMHKIILRK